jgi:hypothetical protein
MLCWHSNWLSVKKYITMKKIFLIGLIAFSVATAEAQKSKKLSSKETSANAKFKKLEASKRLMRDSLIIKMRVEDSTRLAMDSIADLQADSISIAYKENGLHAIDSMNIESYAAVQKNTIGWDKKQKSQNDMIQAAKLSEYKSRQVKIINATYNEKAKAIIQDGDASEKANELVALNEERRIKIKAVLGKSKERKLEKARKSFVKKHGVDEDIAWMDFADTYAKK